MHDSTLSCSFLIITLLIAGLLGTGCGTTKTIGPDGSPHRSEINEEADGNTAKVILRNGEELELDEFRIDGDSASGLVGDESLTSLSTSQIKSIIFPKRGKGALVGGLSLSVPTFISMAIIANQGDVSTSLTAALSAPVGLIGAGTGALIGRKTYKFETPSSPKKPKVPIEEEKRVVAKNEVNPDEESETLEKEGSGAVSVVDTQVPETDMRRPNDIAVVLGNRAYKNSDIPNVDYAVRDAKIMKRYLTRTLGFRKENVIYVENASGSAMARIFGTAGDPKGQLHDWVREDQSNVFVYYSGHGAPNPETGNAYLLPSDANPSYLTQNGYPLTQLYENLSKLPAQSVTVALEACFSGISEGGAVVQNASPAVLSVENPMLGMKNGLVFTAGAADQIASWYNEKKHGLFTYYFLKGLRSKADANSNKAVTANEMESYLNDKVPYRAQRMYSRKQTPQVIGQNKDQVLVEYE